MILLFVEYVMYQKINDKIQVNCPAFKIAVDNHNIFSGESFWFSKSIDGEALKAERMNVDGFIHPTNAIW